MPNKSVVHDGTHQCLFCQEYFEGWGHNPEPLRPFHRGRVCDDCNQHIVLTVRMAIAMHTEPVIPIRCTQPWLNAMKGFDRSHWLLCLSRAYQEQNKRKEAELWQAVAAMGQTQEGEH